MMQALLPIVASLTLAQTPSLDSLPDALVRAQAALAAGRVADAIDVAQHYTLDHSRDPRGFLTLGDAYAARMPDGRFRAIEAYREAARLAPRSHEAPYRIAQMGLRLGGADGERIAGDALERVLDLDPLYKDAWDQWLGLYRNSGGRRKMIERLLPYRGQPVIHARVAQLLIEEERYPEANALLDSVLVTDSTNVLWLALRAQGALEAGDTLEGIRVYRNALAHAAYDSTGELWRQVVGIATPDEVRVWGAGVPGELRGPWLEGFWARRNPDLFASINPRIAEHFARLRYARKHYPLWHPLSLFQRSALARTLNLEPSHAEREFYLRCEVYQALAPSSGLQVSLPGVSNSRDQSRVAPGLYSFLTDEERESLRMNARVKPGVEAAILRADPFAFSPTVFLPLGLDLRNVDTTAARVGYNLATGLDDRGIMYLRFGAPEHLTLGGDNAIDPSCQTMDVERWHYAEWGEVRFAKPSALSRGTRNVSEMLFRPMNERQFAGMQLGLTRDASSESAPLDFGVWLAQFRDERDTTRTDLVVVSTRGELAGSLVGTVGGAAEVRQSMSGQLTMSAPPGGYTLVTDAREGDRLGRQSLGVRLRRFDSQPAMSDLLLAKPWSSDSPDRDAMLAHIQRDLTFSVGDVVRAYAEVYGLRKEVDVESYHATYWLLKTNDPRRDLAKADWHGATLIAFDRVRRVAGANAAVELLDLTPTGIPSGKYLLRLEIFDNVAKKPVGRATMAFEAR
jgi:tetratricopeptide (TPR) repeat protein